MHKVYENTLFLKIIGVILLIAAISALVAAVTDGSQKDILVASVGLIVMCWIALMGFMTKITINDAYIRVDFGGLSARRELGWKEIGRVVDISYSGGLHVFHLIPMTEGKRRVFISNGIANYKDLLREVVQRAPQASVNESTKKKIGMTTNR